MRLIRNGSAYPQAIRTSVIASWNTALTTGETMAQVAAAHGVSVSTAQRWAKEAGCAAHATPKAVTANNARVTRNRATKAFNTPTVNANGDIVFKGKVYK